MRVSLVNISNTGGCDWLGDHHLGEDPVYCRRIDVR
jgi:hypothetical protein